MLKKVFANILSGISGLWIASYLIQGVEYKGLLVIVIFGAILGLFNALVKPLLKIITIPLNLFTLGLAGLLLNILIVWLIIDILSPIEIIGLLPLLLTTIILWLANLAIALIL